jgi:drug/metabolite transporter (DMT)-like permease
VSDRFLFWVPTLIWATTWHAILYQLGDVSVLHSVAMRFGLASLMLFAIARWRGESVVFSPGLHGWLLLTGAVQYGFNYIGTYEAEKHLASGLMAVLFSLMIFTNAIGGALCFGQAISRKFMFSAVFGVLGIVLIFWPDIASTRADPEVLGAVGMGLMAVTFASVGNMMTLRLTRRGTALVPLLAWSMGYGAATLLLIAALRGVAFHLDQRPSYWWSLFYLSALGSVVAFLLYFKLAQRQGPGRAALVGMIIPVAALLMSALFEGWRPTMVSGAGIVLCLAGLWGATRPTLIRTIEPMDG